MFGIQELATAAQYGIGVTTIVFNNRSYGNVLRDQIQQFGGRTIGAELENPDFIKLAESFGVAAQRVSTPEALRGALERALGTGRPALLEVTLDRGEEMSPWDLIHMRTRPSRRSPA